MSNKSEKDAIEHLMGLVRAYKTSPRATTKNASNDIEEYIQSQPLFGHRGDRLLHILIQNDNPQNFNECEKSMWTDAPSASPSAPNEEAAKSASRAQTRSADVTVGRGSEPVRPMSIKMPRGAGPGTRRTDSRNDTATNSGPKDKRQVSEAKVAQADNRGLGRLLLERLLRNARLRTIFTKKPEAPSGQNETTESLPVYRAFDVNNLAFLACFLGMYCDPELKSLRQVMDTIIETKDRFGNGNCIHMAIAKGNPFTSYFVARCSEAALKAKDNSMRTPLHFAMTRTSSSRWIPKPPAIFQTSEDWDESFTPESIFAACESRPGHKILLRTLLTSVDSAGKSPLQCRLSLKDATEDLKNKLKAAIFEHVESIADVSTALYGTNGTAKELFLNMADFNQASHNFHAFVEKMTQSTGHPHSAQSSKLVIADTASQKTSQPEPTISSSSAPAESQSLAENQPPDESQSPALNRSPADNHSVIFEDILFFVHLPDLNYVKQPCPHSTISKLFQWLKACGVRTIRRLRIPDNTQNPLSEAFVQKYILDEFRIESLDWRKLDINIDVLLRSTAGDNDTSGERGPRALDGINKDSVLQNLTLYSSGNWSTLYHWSSSDGLVLFRNLRMVEINIVQLQQTENFYDMETHHRHGNLCKLYQNRLKMRFADLAKDKEYVKAWKTQVNASWDYPLPPLEPEDPTSQVVKHQFTAQLRPSFAALRTLIDNKDPPDPRRGHDNDFDDDDDEVVHDESGAGIACESENDASVWKYCHDRLRKHALAPATAADCDDRIRVAIIDNGADRVRSPFRGLIEKGQSFVSVDEFHDDQPLPWWMVSDAHGTQMASLVTQANPYCRLYIARVGTRRNDIRAKSAMKAIYWAIEHDVDVISMSWTLDYDDPNLKAAIEKAAARRILMFASTPDQGVYSEAWPANYGNTISVSATDQYGHLTSKARTTKTANLQIPGENVRAARPAYISNTAPVISGSSVATALAAGLASMALLLLRTFNDKLPHQRPGSERDPAIETKFGKRHFYYTKEGMLSVFKRMDVRMGTSKDDEAILILLRQMFPFQKKRI